MKALLYQKKNNIGQYHKSKTKNWFVKLIDNQSEQFVNSFSGNICSNSEIQEIAFHSIEAAQKYLSLKVIEYTIYNDKSSGDFSFNSYTKNFI